MKILKAAGISALIGSLSAALLLFVSGLIIRNSPAPEEHFTLCALICALLSGLAAGAVCVGREGGGSGGACLLTGALMCVLPALLSFFGGEKPLWQTALTVCLVLLSPFLAGILILRFGEKRKSAKRKRKRTGR